MTVEIVVIELWWQSQLPTRLGDHAHWCPRCYTHVPCAFECSIEPDLSHMAKQLVGGMSTCDDCVLEGAAR